VAFYVVPGVSFAAGKQQDSSALVVSVLRRQMQCRTAGLHVIITIDHWLMHNASGEPRGFIWLSCIVLLHNTSLCLLSFRLHHYSIVCKRFSFWETYSRQIFLSKSSIRPCGEIAKCKRKSSFFEVTLAIFFFHDLERRLIDLDLKTWPR